MAARIVDRRRQRPDGTRGAETLHGFVRLVLAAALEANPRPTDERPLLSGVVSGRQGAPACGTLREGSRRDGRGNRMLRKAAYASCQHHADAVSVTDAATVAGSTPVEAARPRRPALFGSGCNAGVWNSSRIKVS